MDHIICVAFEILSKVFMQPADRPVKKAEMTHLKNQSGFLL